MPVIVDFDYYVDAMSIAGAIRARAALLANEEINGRHWNDSYYDITGNSAVYGNIEINGTTYLGANISASSQVAGSLTSIKYLRANTTCQALLTGVYEYGAGRAYLPALVSFGADRPVISGVTYLPQVITEGYSSDYVPPDINAGFALLTGLSGWGAMVNPNIGETYVSALVSKGWLRDISEEPFTDEVCEGVATLRGLFSFAEEGQRLEAMWYSKVLLIPLAYNDKDIVLIFSSDLEAVSVWTIACELLSQFLSNFNLGDAFSASGIYALAYNDALQLNSFFSGLLDGEAATFIGGTTWVFNADTQSSVQYDRFNFNSFAKRSTDYVAAAADGIYTLAGDTDEGVAIQSLVELGLSRFETPQIKYFPAVYLGVTSSGRMILKAVVDGQTWLYEARNTAANMQNQRVDLGKGLRGSHWQFSVLNNAGSDFELESVEFMPLTSSRRVY